MTREATLITQARAAQLFEVPANTIGILVQRLEIPTEHVGTAKCLDAAGLRRLSEVLGPPRIPTALAS